MKTSGDIFLAHGMKYIKREIDDVKTLLKADEIVQEYENNIKNSENRAIINKKLDSIEESYNEDFNHHLKNCVEEYCSDSGCRGYMLPLIYIGEMGYVCPAHAFSNDGNYFAEKNEDGRLNYLNAVLELLWELRHGDIKLEIPEDSNVNVDHLKLLYKNRKRGQQNI